LEFPVVVVADLGKPFNLTDLRAEIILDEQFGLCPQVKPPHTGNRYPSLSCWLARRRQLRELLGEELRLLYVAMTRARDTLILSGTVAQNKLSGLWQQPRQPSTALLAGARAYTDWLGLWFSLNARTEAKDSLAGETTLLRWSIHDPAQLVGPEDQTPALEPAKPCEIAFESEAWRLVQQRLSWQYRFSAATQQPAKTSVSVLRRQAGEANQDDEAALLLPLAGPTLGASVPIRSDTVLSQKTRSASRLSAADIGSAHHEFLQLVSLDRTGSAVDLSQEAHRLQRETRLTPEQLAVFDFDGLAFFWDSTLGRRIRTEKEFVQRELAFTARFAPAELPAMFDQARDPSLEGEFVLVQGVVDLAVISPTGIWLIDFKTDQLVPNELAARVKTYEPQLRLYSAALSKIYQRPVSESWIYFLGLREAVVVDLEMLAGCPPASEGLPIADSQ
jgi:ATP-dependent helicase/nuclease subunit A